VDDEDFADEEREDMFISFPPEVQNAIEQVWEYCDSDTLRRTLMVVMYMKALTAYCMTHPVDCRIANVGDVSILWRSNLC
jgi:hypothetical protein